MLKGKDTAKIIVYILILCAILLASVGITAHTAKLQYDINKLNSQIAETQTDIKTLEVRIKSASNITNVEERAEELGFVYPEFDQIRYIAADSSYGVDVPAVTVRENVCGCQFHPEKSGGVGLDILRAFAEM